MADDNVETKINSIRINNISRNKMEESSCDINNFTDSDSVIDEEGSNNIRAEFLANI